MKFSFFIVFLFVTICSIAQQSVIDNLKQAINKPNDDSTRFGFLVQIGELYAFNNADSSIVYIKKAMTLAEDRNNPLWMAHANSAVSLYFLVAGDFASALNLALKNINEFEQYRDPYVFAFSTLVLANVYQISESYEKAFDYNFKTIDLLDTMHYVNNMHGIHFLNNKSKTLITAYNGLANMHLNLNKMDSALLYGKKACEVNITEQINWNYPLYILATIYEKTGRTDSALSLYRRSVSMAIKENIMIDVVQNYAGMAKLFKEKGRNDSAIHYARKAIALESEINYKLKTPEAYLLLSEVYENRQMNDSAFYYYKYAMAARDSLFNQEKIQQVQRIAFKEELRERELQQQAQLEQTEYRNKIKVYIVLGIAVSLLSIALILWRNNRQKQKANALLQQKNEQVEHTLVQLKATQAQLIQSEKMASLGELTSGIAHEIQNPLNFVNNFSEVNSELIDEMQQEIKAGNSDEAIAIANNLKDNQEKIKIHGKRADAIVKGMLQHSRHGQGVKQPSDINKLADEYLRLAFQGLRARDKSFNTTIQTDFDETIGNINIIPQEIGRVILNLVNNAFYAVGEKKKQQPIGYEPIVSITTRSVNGKVEIAVKDNGNGIPEKVVDKIFQPFFTTKPTGQGTGLGLSLAYDIVKAHGGEIKVETKEGDGSEFIIQLP